MKAYLLTYNSVFRPEDVHQILSGTHAVETWVSPFPYAAILLSDLALNELTAVLHTHFVGIWFILAEMHREHVNGWLPEPFWKYISDPQEVLSKKLFEEFVKNLPPTAA